MQLLQLHIHERPGLFLASACMRCQQSVQMGCQVTYKCCASFFLGSSGSEE